MRRNRVIFRSAETPDPEFTDVVELDLATVEPSLAGPEASTGPSASLTNEENV